MFILVILNLESFQVKSRTLARPAERSSPTARTWPSTERYIRDLGFVGRLKWILTVYSVQVHKAGKPGGDPEDQNQEVWEILDPEQEEDDSYENRDEDDASEDGSAQYFYVINNTDDSSQPGNILGNYLKTFKISVAHFWSRWMLQFLLLEKWTSACKSTKAKVTRK